MGTGLRRTGAARGFAAESYHKTPPSSPPGREPLDLWGCRSNWMPVLVGSVRDIPWLGELSFLHTTLFSPASIYYTFAFLRPVGPLVQV